MGNGTSGTSGPGSTILKALPLPAGVTISNLFPNQTIVFPFTVAGGHAPAAAGCFGR
jgi:hypothetical protein